MLYPLKFDKVLKRKIWGGRALEEKLNIPLPQNNRYGESWEVTAHKNGMSVVSEGELKGQTLESLINEYKGSLIGKEVYEEFGNKFPLLIKYLDINDKLSIQVHPDNFYKGLEEGEFGKSEVWYVMDATDDAELILGITDGVSKEKFEEKTSQKNFDGLFNIIKVKKGDFINVKPGLAHASLRGSIFICEIQQNSDTTYRIYDFNRLVDGEYRELHLEDAINVLDFEMKPEISHIEERSFKTFNNTKIEKLIESEYFIVDRLIIQSEYREGPYRNFMIYSIIDGDGELEFEGQTYLLKKGDTYLIPAKIGELEITGELEILKSYI